MARTLWHLPNLHLIELRDNEIFTCDGIVIMLPYIASEEASKDVVGGGMIALSEGDMK